MQLDRASGILLHVSSLPSRYGIGDVGPGAYQFLEFLRRSRQKVWQVLPLVPVDGGGSPYSSSSTFAGNTLFVSPDLLLRDGLIAEADVDRSLAAYPPRGEDRVDYPTVARFKDAILAEALAGFRSGRADWLAADYDAFQEAHSYWLDDFALFTALKESFEGRAWTSWPAGLAGRDPAALERAREELSDRIEHHRFAQFLFERQWDHLRKRARHLGIQILGDLPIYVAHDSADVWAHPALFELDSAGNPTVVAGVPPDYFSETGQRWGNPIYRWELMAQKGYRWWLQRLARSFELVDMLRIDHFRGLEAYWEIPANEPTAVNGRWVPGPGAALFRTLEKELGELPIVAEDLGLITPEVTALMDQLGFPGMAVLHFAFGGDAEASYLPHNFRPNLVAYTGTHDNDTTVGWWKTRVGASAGTQENREQAYLRRYVRLEDDSNVHWALIHLLMASVARLVVFPLQDVLGLGSEARMNVPGQNDGNWQWRLSDDHLPEQAAERLREMVEVFGRDRGSKEH